MRHATELRDFCFKRGAFAAQNKLLRCKNVFNCGAAFRANRSVLGRKIELRYGIEQGSGLWVRAHRISGYISPRLRTATSQLRFGPLRILINCKFESLGSLRIFCRVYAIGPAQSPIAYIMMRSTK